MIRIPSPEATAVVPLEVPPSIKLISAAVDVIFVPPISNVVAETSPATVNIPLATVSKSVSPVCPIVEPLIITLSTVKAVKVPKLVIADCAAVVTVAAVPEALPVKAPTKVVEVSIPVLGL